MENVRKLKRIAVEIFLDIIKEQDDVSLVHLIEGLQQFKARVKTLSDGKQ